MGIVMITMKPIGHPLDFPMDFHKMYGRGACNENVEDFIQIIVDHLSEKDLICLWNLTEDAKYFGTIEDAGNNVYMNKMTGQVSSYIWDLCYDDDTVIDFVTNGYYNLDITVMPDGMLIIRL